MLLSPPHAQCCQTIRSQLVELGPEILHGWQTEAEADSADAFEFSNEEYLELVADMAEEELPAKAAARAAPRRAAPCSSCVGTSNWPRDLARAVTAAAAVIAASGLMGGSAGARQCQAAPILYD